MKPILFTLALLGVFSLLNMYISKRLITHLDITLKHKHYLRIFLVLNLIGILFYVLGRYYINIPNWLYFLFSLPVGVLFLLFCTTVIYDISRVLLHHTPLSPKRRKFFKRSLDASSLLAASSLSAKAIYNARTIELEKVEIKIKKLNKEYKIIQLSDIHIGGLIDKNFINILVKRVNATNPDLVVITGDLVDIEISKAQAAMDELKKLDSKYGTFFIVGNHEYFHNIEKIIQSVKSIGIRVLENENVYIGKENEGFNLAGVYDVFGYRSLTFIPDLESALKGKKDAPTVLLAHQPKYIDEVQEGVDLMLSGHTHGGQLYPFRFLVKVVQPYISGLHQHNENLQIYVNKGTGFWGPPMRLGASAEISEIRLLPS
ncbi:metallophosphoesterase [Sulfurimonas aquatica]|uniref:Metallophosphoesterase n=1 Tax=Sulfurimonas aquatica TaxID=2672570 RepID=A0A975AY87_9BACT|nr:metallophosphoesterase [Sulfurimonas aquatica]QSZ40680.1 metallophosphoesterase [Sulfurimonas aquatica]